MNSLYTHIRQLVNVAEGKDLLRGSAMSELSVIDDAYLWIQDGIIKAYGPMHSLEVDIPDLPAVQISLEGRFVLPTWVDSHTHTVFPGPREGEFIDKIKGLTYAEIAARGGGILQSAKKLAETSEDQLFDMAFERIQNLKKLGTGAIEIKSGYGLTVESELKMLRVIQRLKSRVGIPVRASFLGAHSFPAEYKDNHRGYIDLLIDEMLPAIGTERLADYIDVFCEEGFFSAEDTREICEAGAKYGLKPRLHVNQLNSIGGIKVGMEVDALALDHLETMTEEDIRLMGEFKGTAGLLPTAAFFLRMPMQPARKLIEAGAALVLASDFNPGSSPSGNMNFVAAIAAIQMRMMPAEIVHAATTNAAYSLQLESELGSIYVGKKANLIFTKPIPSLGYLMYSFGENLIESVVIEGGIIVNY